MLTFHNLKHDSLIPNLIGKLRLKESLKVQGRSTNSPKNTDEL